jgi:hypothetical protein
MLLDKFLGKKDNHQLFDYKSHVEIAAIAAGNLEFPISPSTVTMTYQAMVTNGDEVWASPPRRTKMNNTAEIVSMKKKFAEQDRKFKIIFEKLHALASSAQDVQENFNFNNGGGDGTELAV